MGSTVWTCAVITIAVFHVADCAAIDKTYLSKKSSDEQRYNEDVEQLLKLLNVKSSQTQTQKEDTHAKTYKEYHEKLTKTLLEKSSDKLATLLKTKSYQVKSHEDGTCSGGHVIEFDSAGIIIYPLPGNGHDHNEGDSEEHHDETHDEGEEHHDETHDEEEEHHDGTHDEEEHHDETHDEEHHDETHDEEEHHDETHDEEHHDETHDETHDEEEESHDEPHDEEHHDETHDEEEHHDEGHDKESNGANWGHRDDDTYRSSKKKSAQTFSSALSSRIHEKTKKNEIQLDTRVDLAHVYGSQRSSKRDKRYVESYKKHKRIYGARRAYTKNEDEEVQCSYAIKVSGTKVHLVIETSGSSECSDGQLKLFNGENNDGEPFATLCGENEPTTYVSEGNEVLVEYSRGTGKGSFTVLWVADD